MTYSSKTFIGLLIGCLCLALSINTHSQTQKNHQVTARLSSQVDAIQPGTTFWLGVQLDMVESVHTYWKNPGNSGLPTRIKWNLPHGFIAGDILWPAPEKFVTASEVTYGYSDRVILVVPIQSPEALSEKTVKLSAKVSWLACSDVCIPGDANISIELPVAKSSKTKDTEASQLWQKMMNRIPRQSSDWQMKAFVKNNRIQIRLIATKNHEDIQDMQFFIEQENVVDHSNIYKIKNRKNTYQITYKSSPYSQKLPSLIKGVLVYNQGDTLKTISLKTILETHGG